MNSQINRNPLCKKLRKIEILYNIAIAMLIALNKVIKSNTEFLCEIFLPLTRNAEKKDVTVFLSPWSQESRVYLTRRTCYVIDLMFNTSRERVGTCRVAGILCTIPLRGYCLYIAHSLRRKMILSTHFRFIIWKNKKKEKKRKKKKEQQGNSLDYEKLLPK